LSSDSGWTELRQLSLNIRREWEYTAGAVETKSVTAIRDQEKGRMMMWTETELKNLGKPSASKTR
jgi:hypothetical protein